MSPLAGSTRTATTTPEHDRPTVARASHNPPGSGSPDIRLSQNRIPRQAVPTPPRRSSHDEHPVSGTRFPNLTHTAPGEVEPSQPGGFFAGWRRGCGASPDCNSGVLATRRVRLPPPPPTSPLWTGSAAADHRPLPGRSDQQAPRSAHGPTRPGQDRVRHQLADPDLDAPDQGCVRSHQHPTATRTDHRRQGPQHANRLRQHGITRRVSSSRGAGRGRPAPLPATRLRRRCASAPRGCRAGRPGSAPRRRPSRGSVRSRR